MSFVPRQCGDWGASSKALTTGSYASLKSYLTDISLTRLQMGFDIAEVIEALLLCKDAALPVIWRTCPSDSVAGREAIAQLDSCLRFTVGCFGRLYAEEMSQHLRNARDELGQRVEEKTTELRNTNEKLRGQIRERTQTEEELREREAQYRSIFESTSDALLIFDLDGTIVETNPAACRMYGYPYEELVGLPGQDIVHPDYHHLFEDFKRQVKASGRFHAQSVDLRKDGSPINVEVHGASFSYRGKPHLLAVARDITERVLARQMLERRVEERTREIEQRRRVAEGLREILAILNSSRPLKEILDFIVAQVVPLLGANAGVVYHIDSLEQSIIIESASGMPDEFMSIGPIPLTDTKPNRAILNRQPYAVTDFEATLAAYRADDPSLPPEIHAWIAAVSTHFGSYLSVPLIVNEKVYGAISIFYREPREFSDEEIKLAVAFSDQVALAIENAKLRQRAERAAVIEERGRLARELHDSVTQSLYSMTLFAEAARRLSATGEQESAEEHLSQLGETSQQALKEMRLLVYELRPSTLEEEGLVGVLRQRLDTVEKRAGVEAQLSVEGQFDLPKEIEEGLYRIAQEALNNALKHAAATAVTVRIRIERNLLTMEITDDGRGFDLDAATDTGGIGLSSMQERAKKLNGDLRIASTPGKGTRVQVQVKVR